ncbi:hypothetical protein ACIBCU_38120 [Streptomyces sp. NPDC051064]|uniref:hypothetical protein n=1 Tax=Streptomyces sp. NPDC051064 TaxID=3365641 RepID=UPI0037953CB3
MKIWLACRNSICEQRTFKDVSHNPWLMTRRPTDDASQLRNALASAQDVVSVLEEETADDDVPAETERRLADIAALTSPFRLR